MLTDPDGSLPLARRRLADAVHALADPIPVWVDGTCRWSDPLYATLRAELAGATVVRQTHAHTSRLPCHTGILQLLVEVDTAVCSWTDGKGTVDRLHVLVDHGWRPQDCELIGDYGGQIERWTLAGAELLDAPAKVFLRQPCPRCGAGFTHRADSAGETVNMRALKVSENGCTCLHCGAFWPPDRFEWLARLLGCDPLPV